MSVPAPTDRVERGGFKPLSWWWLAVPQLFALAPLISFFAANADELELSDMVVPLATAVALTAVATLGVLVLGRRVSLAVVFGSALAALYYNFGHALSLMEDSGRIARLPVTPATLLGAFCGAVFVVLTLLAFRFPASMDGLARITAIVGASLAVTSSMSAANMVARYERAERELAAVESALRQASPQPAAAEVTGSAVATLAAEPSRRYDSLPDIYYLVLDGYGSNGALEEAVGFENSAFTDYLEKRGFYVAYDTKSNYSQTFLCLGSVLNMAYINDIVEGWEGSDRTVLYGMVKDSQVVRTLKKHGYKYVHITSGWGPTNVAPLADVVHEVGGSELESALGGTTMFRPLADESDSRIKHEAVTEAFDLLAAEKQGKRPKFVFAHILAPHGPYVFKADGSLVTGSASDMANWEREQRDDYVAQLRAVNRLTREAVEAILAKNERPVIIVIQGDHGTSFPSGGVARRRWRERHSILNALYFSPGTPPDIYPSISPVNTFRLVIDDALGTGYPLLPDRAYNSRNYDHPYDLLDVTRHVSMPRAVSGPSSRE